ncbi:sigma-70 family RNA polymerase sigma factor [Adhaeretor mobilis]|uniref:ECF RNA polymerase sigma factor SigW n=1 Tax=Adhaeretor mobilis TaxID=1930276 RepID=A0A517MZL9_9BACT|nr:sigma-70 family RNA polymerase sigma factor [Adhaeretor mobilis]QDT00327.1 ECF RNA polymerase sigma factor SigW [Adhaeretor mobilis]
MKSSTEETEELESRLARGDRTALVELFGLHRERLWRIVYFRLDKRVATRLDPDDVLQDAYLDASQRLGHYSNQQQYSPFVWLRMIVGQTLIDAHRRHIGAKQRDATREVSINGSAYPRVTSASLTFGLLGNLTSPSRAVVRSETAVDLRKAIETMETLDQEVLALRHFEELTNKEVAEVLGVSEKAASIRYVRAVGRLKKLLEELPEFSNLLNLFGGDWE